MILKNTYKQFGIITILLHWLMALLIIGLLALGLYMVRMPISLQKLQYYGWHKEIGILVLMLAVVRLAWRLRNINPTLDSIPVWEQLAARAVHWLFYFFMFAMPITGWMITSSADLPVNFFGLFTLPNLVAASEPNRLFYTEIHEWLGYVLIAIVCMHTAAALKHHFINKDTILRRML